ncbi:hypothetical protein Q8X48_12940 [Pseudomonas sp. QLc11A]|uniref:Uncharacterized protein n=1 Tax=Pseudomonas azerbaijanorientalis TaxID=2842350 RepID=A0ABW8W626_9PSED
MSWESISIWIESHPGLASWVQALGVLITIVVAIVVAKWPEKRLRREQSDKTRVMKHAIVNIALGADGAISALRDEVDEIDWSKTSFPDALLMATEAHMITLSSVDLTNFPNEEMLVPFMRIKAEMESGVSACKSLKLSIPSELDRFATLTRLDAAANNIRASFLVLRRAASVTGKPYRPWLRAARPAFFGRKLTGRKRIQVNIWLAITALGMATLAPLLANNFFVALKPWSESPGDWLERSGAITTIFSLLVISLMDECLGKIRIKSNPPRVQKFQLYKNFESWASFLKGTAFVISLIGTVIWGYGSVIMAYVNGLLGVV